MNHLRCRASAAACLLGGLLAIGPAWAADGILTADTWVSPASPANNFGALPSMSVGRAASALVRFDLSTLPPGATAANIVKASLVLYAGAVSAPGAVDASVLNSAWTETTVTFATAPSATPIAGAAAMVGSAGQYLVFDVTAVVRNWVNAPSLNYGFQLSAAAATPNLQVAFDSKENTATSHPAQLRIETADTGPAGPAGLQGLQGPGGPVGPQGPLGPIGTSLLAPSFGHNTNQATAAGGATCTIGEVILSAGLRTNSIPASGQTLLVSTYQPLFSVIGYAYSAVPGLSTFNVPDLRAAAPNGLTYSICTAGVFPTTN